MNRIKLYENFGQERVKFTSRIEFDPGQGGTEVELYETPLGMESPFVRGGVVNWDLELLPREWGLVLGAPSATILSMRIEYELQDEDSGDTIEKEIELSEGVLQASQFTCEFGEFPLRLNLVEISMRHTMDPKFWRIKLYIGDK